MPVSSMSVRQLHFASALIDFLTEYLTVWPCAELSTLPDSPPTSRPLWPASCPIDSPLRRGSPPSGSPHREFISPTSHRLAQNPCLHPELADQHGFLIGEKGEWTNPQIRFGPDLFVPVLAMSKVEGMADIGGIPFDKVSSARVALASSLTTNLSLLMSSPD